MKLKNPLSAEERASAAGLIGHDVLSHHEYTFLPDQDEQTMYARHAHVRYILIALAQLTQNEDCFFHSSDINDHFETMQRVFQAGEKNLELQVETKEKKISGEKHILYATLYNLAKNTLLFLKLCNLFRTHILQISFCYQFKFLYLFFK